MVGMNGMTHLLKVIQVEYSNETARKLCSSLLHYRGFHRHASRNTTRNAACNEAQGHCVIPLRKIQTIKPVVMCQNMAFSNTNGTYSTGRFQCVMTVRECKKLAEHVFVKGGISEAMESAMYLIAHVLGRKTLSGISSSRKMTITQLNRLDKLINLRLTRMPIQYVIGEWDFRNLTLDMKPPVLIPRPETEELVEHILSQETFSPGGCFLEVGPGSGAISCSILADQPEMSCVAIDISEEACKLTNNNARKLGVLDRLHVHNAPVNTYHSVSSDRKFDFIVSNPPYIPSKDMNNLQYEVSGFEDVVALHGGDDGLDVIRDILRLAPEILNPGGSVWLEVDRSHPTLIERMTTTLGNGLKYVSTIKDFNKLPRFCHLKLPRRNDEFS